APSIVKTGTLIKFGWPDIPCYLIDYDSGDFYFDARTLLQGYSALNPHATFKLKTGEGLSDWDATGGEFKRWLPSEPTSPHWYDLERFRSLIGAYLTQERNGGKVRTVREFIAEFRGLSGSAKQKSVTDTARLTNCLLSDLIVDGEVNPTQAWS